VDLGKLHFSIPQADLRKSLEFAPAARSVALPQSPQASDAGAYGDGFDARDFTNDLEIRALMVMRDKGRRNQTNG
jgi:hypothetical protein